MIDNELLGTGAAASYMTESIPPLQADGEFKTILM